MYFLFVLSIYRNWSKICVSHKYIHVHAFNWNMLLFLTLIQQNAYLCFSTSFYSRRLHINKLLLLSIVLICIFIVTHMTKIFYDVTIYNIINLTDERKKLSLYVCNVSLLKLKLCLTANAFKLQKCQRHLLEVRKVVAHPSENMALQMFIIIKIKTKKILEKITSSFKCYEKLAT